MITIEDIKNQIDSDEDRRECRKAARFFLACRCRVKARATESDPNDARPGRKAGPFVIVQNPPQAPPTAMSCLAPERGLTMLSCVILSGTIFLTSDSDLVSLAHVSALTLERGYVQHQLVTHLSGGQSVKIALDKDYGAGPVDILERCLREAKQIGTE